MLDCFVHTLPNPYSPWKSSSTFKIVECAEREIDNEHAQMKIENL